MSARLKVHLMCVAQAACLVVGTALVVRGHDGPGLCVVAWGLSFQGGAASFERTLQREELMREIEDL